MHVYSKAKSVVLKIQIMGEGVGVSKICKLQNHRIHPMHIHSKSEVPRSKSVQI